MTEYQKAPKCLPYEAEPVKNPSLNMLSELISQVKHRNVKGASASVIGFRTQFMDEWKESPSHTEFVNTIRFMSQREVISRTFHDAI